MASNLNPANAITASRFLTLPPFVWAIDQGRYQIAALMIIICGLLDLVDGAVARALRCTTPFGEVFDAIADGLCYGTILTVLVIYGWVPWLPVVIVVSLGFANLGLRAVYARRAGRTTNYRSYAMERCVAYAAYLGGFGVSGYEVAYFYWAFTVVYVLVMIHDTKRMLIDPVPAAVPAVIGPPPPPRVNANPPPVRRSGGLP